MNFFKRQLPMIVAFLAGTLLWLQFYVPSKFSQNVLETFSSSWAIIMYGAAFVLGVLSAIEHHWGKVAGRKAGYGYSLVAIFVFLQPVIAIALSVAAWTLFQRCGYSAGGITGRVAVGTMGEPPGSQ